MTDELGKGFDETYVEALRKGAVPQELEESIRDWYGPENWPARKEALENEAYFGNIKAQ